ncbi:hypothetical protein INT80_04200 [Gallibacterium anatis]|uniref:Uncharacterized protein n=1 Tax=Gallibacterium anatis TaxID=750 RepID=A0A930UTF8_9PAST|nr:hypothetical protein [Gallibacterium anatis]
MQRLPRYQTPLQRAAPPGLAADNSGTNTVISGKAEPNSKVVIDGKEYPVNAAGDFSADLGKN